MGSLAENPTQTVHQLDFSRFMDGDRKEQHKFCRDLVGCLTNIGFVKLINHGISDDELREVFDWVRNELILSLINI